MFEIRNNVAPPSTPRTAVGTAVATLKSMRVGQSFVMPVPPNKTPDEYRVSVQNSIRSALRREKMEIGATAHVVDDENGEGVGIWCTEYEAPKTRKPVRRKPKAVPQQAA